MRLVSASICTFCALALVGGNAYAWSAPWHKHKERSAARGASSPSSSPWVGGVEVRHWRGHDTSGHIP